MTCVDARCSKGFSLLHSSDVTSLNHVELGALLWLLQLEPEHYHRLGSGKPLGFGSVRLKINWAKTDLQTGIDWQAYYQSLMPTKASARSPNTTIPAFQQAIEQAYGKPFEQVPLIAAFLGATKGFDWFVENEKMDGKKLALPELVKDQRLPLNPKRST